MISITTQPSIFQLIADNKMAMAVFALIGISALFSPTLALELSKKKLIWGDLAMAEEAAVKDCLSLIIRKNPHVAVSILVAGVNIHPELLSDVNEVE